MEAADALRRHAVAGKEEVSSLIERVDRKLLHIAGKMEVRAQYSTLEMLMEGAEEEIRRRKRNQRESAMGPGSGYRSLTKIMGGWVSGSLVVVAGTSGSGLTALGLGFALHAIKKGVGTAYHSLDLPDHQILLRLLAMTASCRGRPLRIQASTS